MALIVFLGQIMTMSTNVTWLVNYSYSGIQKSEITSEMIIFFFFHIYLKFKSTLV